MSILPHAHNTNSTTKALLLRLLVKFGREEYNSAIDEYEKISSNVEVENMPKGNTCREELLKAVRNIVKSKEINEFSIDEVMDYIKQNGTKFKESTIRTHITSRCCKNAPEHHGVVYEDYFRIGHGVYKLLNEKEGATQIK